jgi:hypothetical protein
MREFSSRMLIGLLDLPDISFMSIFEEINQEIVSKE